MNHNIFVLEDSQERIKWFKRTFHDCNLFFTDDIDIACNKLRNENYDLIFLDRDLGHSNGKSGEDVALIMKKEQLAKNACIIIDTVNPLGQRIMKQYLKEYHDNVHMINFTVLRKMKRKDFNIINN